VLDKDTVRYPFESTPPTGTTLEVAPGVHWLRMPLPWDLDHINLWLIDDDDGWTVVDTGIDSKKTRGIWEDVFADTLGGRPVTRVIVTHFHPDHMGSAAWLCGKWNAPFVTTRAEWLYGRTAVLTPDEEWVTLARGFWRKAGVDDANAVAFTGERSFYRRFVGYVPASYTRMRDGEEIAIGGRRWRIITGDGHSPEHATLFCADHALLISGDMILPEITPNLGVWSSEPAADPLRRYLESLDKFAALPRETTILPSHKVPFEGLHNRLDQLGHHHDAQLAACLAACIEPHTAFEVSRVMYPQELDSMHRSLAVSETLAHLNYLINEGKIGRREVDGVWHYCQKPA
jgi:glyoxylase-like metal-dependent hydrolase (beta-lactamase superfamily II)